MKHTLTAGAMVLAIATGQSVLAQNLPPPFPPDSSFNVLSVLCSAVNTKDLLENLITEGYKITVYGTNELSPGMVWYLLQNNVGYFLMYDYDGVDPDTGPFSYNCMISTGSLDDIITRPPVPRGEDG